MLRCLSGVWWGAHPFSLKLLYNALVRSVLDYGTFLLEPCSVAGLRKLDGIQSKSLRIISGAMKSSPLNALQVECEEPPLQLRRQFLSDRMFYRNFQFLNSLLISKLYHLANVIESSDYWKHKPFPCLVQSLIKFKGICAPTYRSPRLSLFDSSFEAQIQIPTVHFNLELDRYNDYANIHFKSIVQENWPDWHHLYTDASKHTSDGLVGVGVYHAQYNIVQKIKCPSETSVFSGECLGLVKAIDYILLFKLKRSLIISDSMISLQALLRYPFKSKLQFPLISEARSKLHLCTLNGLSVTFVWVPSHCGITGNEKADRLANQAVACGDLVPFINYTHDLASLPRSYLRDTWNRLWERSGRIKGKHYFCIQPQVRTKPWFSNIKLSKIVTSILIRMRLGHTTCPAHLARFGIISSPLCDCGDFGDLDHIFFSCPTYERASFYNTLISIHVPFPTNINTLLFNANPPMYNALSDFVASNSIKL